MWSASHWVETSEAGSVDFDASATLNGKGKLTSAFKFDPKNFKNVDATMKVEDLALADLDAGLAWRLHPALRLGVSVGLRAELAPTTLQVGSEAPYALTPWQEELQLSLRGQIP